jgi:hypothetical protein
VENKCNLPLPAGHLVEKQRGFYVNTAILYPIHPNLTLLSFIILEQPSLIDKLPTSANKSNGKTAILNFSNDKSSSFK